MSVTRRRRSISSHQFQSRLATESSTEFGQVSAIACRYLTSIASSYPDEGYYGLVKEMWDALLSGYTDMQEVVDELLPKVINNEVQKKQFLENNDVSKEELINNPRSIMPHFLVQGHPLSHRLLEEGKLAKDLLR